MIGIKIEKDSYHGNNNKFYYLYKIVNNINGKYYYGVHSTDDLEDGYAGSGKIIKRAINHYGIENFTKYILDFYSNEEDMYQAEKNILTEEELNSNNCYNVSSGGLGGRQGMVVVKDENGNTLVVTREVAKKNSYTSVNSGSGNPAYGKHLSLETKKKLSESIKNHYVLCDARKHTEEEKEHQRSLMIGRFTIKKENVIKYVKKDEMDKYLSDGWDIMCSKKYYINNGETSIFVNRYEHETKYTEWNKGKIKKIKDAKAKKHILKTNNSSPLSTVVKTKKEPYRGKLYEYNGGKYTVKELAKKNGLCEDTIRAWLKKYGTTDPEIVKTIKESDKSRYTGKKYEYNGEELTLIQISKKYGIEYGVLKGRIKLGWNVAECIENRNIKNRKKKSYLYEYNGEYYTIPELSEKFGLSQTMLRQRLMSGMNLNDAITLPHAKDTVKKFMYQGKKYTMREISDAFGIKLSTVKSRFKKGWKVEQVIKTPIS